MAMACCLGAGQAAAPDGSAGANGLIASPAPDWPQWRGPRRDGICDETGLLGQWPKEGPRKLWSVAGLGRGYSAPIVVKGRIFLCGDFEEELRVIALDLDGHPIWQTVQGRSWKNPYPGARASCTWSDGRLFHLNAHGRLACLDPDTGRELWAADILERFDGRNITWALSECVLVDGGRVIVTPGGRRALMAALDIRTGETVWASEPMRLGASADAAHARVAEPAGEIDGASYASPILLRLDGRRQIVNCSERHVFGVDADSGRLLWTRPLPTRHRVIASTPVWCGDSVFVTAPDTEEGGLYRLGMEGDRVRIESLWKTQLDTCQGGVVRVGDALYGSWYRRHRGWACLDLRSGGIRYETRELAMGPVLYADGRLYCLSQEGEMALLEPTPGGFGIRGRFRLVEKRTSDAWTHPVIHGGRLLLRYHERLDAYDIGAGQ